MALVDGAPLLTLLALTSNGMPLSNPDTLQPATMQSALLALLARVRTAGLPGPAVHVDSCEMRGGWDRAGIGEGYSPGWGMTC